MTMRTYNYADMTAWVIPPRNQGQIVEVAYAAAWEDETIIERTYDQGDRSLVYRAYEADGAYEPQNGRLALGDALGECRVVGDRAGAVG